MSDDDVKALADSYKGLLVKIQYHNDEGIISVTGVLTEESREALARVALEFCEARQAVRKESERRKKSWIPK